VIGGPPCQKHSAARNLRAGVRCRAVDLIPQFERIVSEANPAWFLMECTPRAPVPRVMGYQTCDRLLDSRWFGSEQQRKRRFTVGSRCFAPTLPVRPVALMSQRVVRTVTASDGKRNGKGCNLPDRLGTLSAMQMTYEEACEHQGLPRDFLADAPFTKEGRWRVVGNGVPLPLGRAVAEAVRQAIEAADEDGPGGVGGAGAGRRGAAGVDGADVGGVAGAPGGDGGVPAGPAGAVDGLGREAAARARANRRGRA